MTTPPHPDITRLTAALEATAAACASHVKTILDLRAKVTELLQSQNNLAKITRESTIEECATTAREAFLRGDPYSEIEDYILDLKNLQPQNPI